MYIIYLFIYFQKFHFNSRFDRVSASKVKEEPHDNIIDREVVTLASSSSEDENQVKEEPQEDHQEETER